ncbi:MAG: DNA primase [Bacteroidota bacterium]
MIKQSTVDQILAAAQVEDVIGDYVNLKRRGSNLLGLCPFHNEKTPSFTVSPSKNLFKCFGCGIGGSPVTFLMEHESFTYPEALRHLAKKYNIKIEEEQQSQEHLEEQKHKESLLIINQMASQFFVDQLSTEEGRSIGLSYFKHRGLLESTLEQFGLGYGPRDPKSFVNYATGQGYKLDLLTQLGLVSKSGYDFFRERVIFPFHNLSGKVIGFGGRILKENVKAPKYLNSPETPIYNKRQTLYGLYQAKKTIRQEGKCILVEGYMDVLSLHQNGISNAVASSGTSLTSEQVRLIKRFADEVLVLYDGDAAGQRAALRGLNLFLEFDVNVKLATLPDGHDPDTYVRELGSTAFSTYLDEHGQDFILLLAKNIVRDHKNDPVQKSVAIRELVDSIALIGNQIKRAVYTKECATILDIDESSLIKEANKVIRKTIQRKQLQRPRDTKPVPQKHIDFDPNEDHSQGIRAIVDDTDYQERDIIRVLFTDGTKKHSSEEDLSVAEYVLANLHGVIELVKDPLCKEILIEYQAELEKERVPDQQHWLSHENENVRRMAVDLLSDKWTYADWSKRGLELQTQKPIEENFVKDSYQVIMRYKLKKINERIQEIKALFDKQEDESRDILLITAYQRLLQDRQQLAGELGVTVF